MAGVTERHLWSPAARMKQGRPISPASSALASAHDHVIPIIATKHRVDRCRLDMLGYELLPRALAILEYYPV